jgi:hypothetical protein
VVCGEDERQEYSLAKIAKNAKEEKRIVNSKEKNLF